MTESISEAVTQLVFVGAYETRESAEQAVREVIEENSIPVSEDGRIDGLTYMDIVHELKG